MNAQILIMSHSDLRAHQTFDRHLPWWRMFGWPMTAVGPATSPPYTGLKVVRFGKASHHDAESIRRFRYFLRYAETLPCEWILLFEYDSLCLSGEVPSCFHSPGVLVGNWFRNIDRRYVGSQFLHPPLWMHKDTLRRVLEVAKAVPDNAECGVWDRWLGYVCDIGKIDVQGWGHYGFSRNTIHEGDLDSARRAVRGGATMIHGVKDSKTLEVLAEEAEVML